MFTGLIQAICTVKSIRQSGGGSMLTVDLSELSQDCKIGDSIAINGICLTIADLIGNTATFELSAETLDKSAMGKLQPGTTVNAERAIKATDRLGGHFVLGHVDGTATIRAVIRRGEFADMKFAADPELLSRMVVKGSVAVDGISLTIAELDESSFGVAIIPETLKRTTLGQAKIGDEVNIETDIIIKTVIEYLKRISSQEQPLTVEKLKQLGF